MTLASNERHSREPGRGDSMPRDEWQRSDFTLVAGDSAEFAAETSASEPLLKLPVWSIPFVILIIGWGLFAWRVGQRGLWSAHEGRAAQNAQNMLDTGEWIVPRLFTDDYELQKPPLYYWMVAAISLTQGDVGPISVRAPSTGCALLGLVLVYFLGRRMWDVETGVAAAVILASCTRYAWVARVGRIDMPLAVLCLGAMFLAWKTVTDTNPRARVSWWFYVLAGLGLLLKGPVVLVLLMLPIATYCLLAGLPVIPGLQPGWTFTWRRYQLFSGPSFALALAAPWFVYASYKSDGSFFWQFFVYHNLDRALGTTEELKAGPFWFYLPRLFADSFPWCLLFGPLGIALWRMRQQIRRATDLIGQNYLFLLSWMGSVLLFLSIVSFKRADYLLPVYPALALLLAGWLRDRLASFEERLASRPARNPRRRDRTILITAFLLATAAAPLMVWAIIEFLKKGVVKSILKVDLLGEHLNETDRFMMRHLERLIRDGWPLLGITLVVVVGCLWVFHTGWHSRKNRWILTGMAGPWLATYLFHVHVLLPPLDQLRDMAQFADVIRGEASPGRPIYYFGKFDDDLVFYAGKPARLIGEWEDLVKLGQSNEHCYVVMKQKHLEWVRQDQRLAHWLVVADNQPPGFVHRQPRVLLTNNPLAVANRLGNAANRSR